MAMMITVIVAICILKNRILSVLWDSALRLNECKAWAHIVSFIINYSYIWFRIYGRVP